MCDSRACVVGVCNRVPWQMKSNTGQRVRDVVGRMLLNGWCFVCVYMWLYNHNIYTPPKGTYEGVTLTS